MLGIRDLNQLNALLVGNSDGIGLAMTKRLLALGWYVIGISRSESPITDKSYTHYVLDVTDSQFASLLDSLIIDNSLDLCIYSAGIGELINLSDMKREVKIMDVNLLGMVRTTSTVIPHMIERNQGHFIGISSLADELLSSEAPSYHASKAGFSNYLESLARSLKKEGVFVTNIRFGFVDTKMAKGDIKPFIMSVEEAVNHLVKCMKNKPIRYTAPKIVIPLIKFRKIMMRITGQ